MALGHPAQHGRFSSKNEVQQTVDASGIKVGQQSWEYLQFDEVGAKLLVTACARLVAL
ncbi:DNA helicase II [Aeromonas molluscorum 848]|uniref:DNA helicase II n=1 Tax=Aeromonas molluscorum 848 TaxID=1268236 RepID=R1F1P8_9GAMM|nr:DNA helicase II [Aeromonas molluscorum 848]